MEVAAAIVAADLAAANLAGCWVVAADDAAVSMDVAAHAAAAAAVVLIVVVVVVVAAAVGTWPVSAVKCCEGLAAFSGCHPPDTAQAFCQAQHLAPCIARGRSPSYATVV